MNKVKISSKSRINYTTLQKKYGGMYVLMDKPDGKVVAVSRNLGKAFKEAEKKGFQAPAVQFVPPYGVITMYEVKISIRR